MCRRVGAEALNWKLGIATRKEGWECRALDKHLQRDSPGNSPADRPKELAKVGDQAVLPPETVGQVSVGFQASAGETGWDAFGTLEIEKADDRTTRDEATCVARAQALVTVGLSRFNPSHAHRAIAVFAFICGTIKDKSHHGAKNVAS